MAGGVVWMSREQIAKRAGLLGMAEEAALVFRSALSRTDARDEFISSLVWVAMVTIRRARRQLEAAERAAAEGGGAPVPNDCLAIFTALNRVRRQDWVRLVREEPASA